MANSQVSHQDREIMHHLVIGPRRAATVCGIRIAAYYPNSHEGMPARAVDPNIKCCAQPDFHGVLVTCPRCNPQVRPAPKSTEALANDVP